MEKRVLRSAAWLLLLWGCTALWGQCALAAAPSRPMRVAYIEAGFTPDFSGTLVALGQGLERLALIARGNVPVTGNENSTRSTWQWLAANAGGTVMYFVPDAYYTAGWDSALLEEQKNALVQRIARDKDIDLVLSFGTKASQLMVNADMNTPLVMLAVSDAVSTGLVASAQDSGKDHVFALVEENRFYHELMLFHNIFKFSTLGVAYEDNEVGRGTIALSQIEQAARDAKFELVTCTGRFLGEALEAADDLIACHERFAEQKVDAVYVTLSTGLLAGRMNEILYPLQNAGLPTFSQNGMGEVKQGALMSVSRANFRGQGRFAARAIANILKGQSPREQAQVHEEPLRLAVNLYTAMRIGWTPSLAVLAAVDTIFER